MIEGEAVYDQEIMDLAKKLKAKGIFLLVIEGERNTNDLEFGSVLRAGDVLRICEALRAVANEFEKNWETIAAFQREVPH